ncbi:hypothetical protein HZH68_016221 [Vespula germanica]|uniref:Uncharacterized protein n=1 Tax=Vespula germanica TaxID=30212 RepID=A0A834J7B5_VESGE|nr:hypothetical protein HZH68_016221 [Vespula germanica]
MEIGKYNQSKGYSYCLNITLNFGLVRCGSDDRITMARRKYNRSLLCYNQYYDTVTFNNDIKFIARALLEKPSTSILNFNTREHHESRRVVQEAVGSSNQRRNILLLHFCTHGIF